MLREIILHIRTRCDEPLDTIERDIEVELNNCTIDDLTIVAIEEKAV